uniref:XRCC1_N domain-containing protein n=1 Tax=Macrostomum lignano TaxID=282301 RepID=A0A1I8F649_9PLAT
MLVMKGSALVEVLVSRDADPGRTPGRCFWQLSSLMSPADAKKGLRFESSAIFQSDQLHKPACNEKWDKIRVGDFAICDEPRRNRHDQKNGVGDDKKKPAAGKNGSEDSITRPGGLFSRGQLRDKATKDGGEVPARLGPGCPPPGVRGSLIRLSLT